MLPIPPSISASPRSFPAKSVSPTPQSKSESLNVQSLKTVFPTPRSKSASFVQVTLMTSELPAPKSMSRFSQFRSEKLHLACACVYLYSVKRLFRKLYSQLRLTSVKGDISAIKVQKAVSGLDLKLAV